MNSETITYLAAEPTRAELALSVLWFALTFTVCVNLGFIALKVYLSK